MTLTPYALRVNGQSRPNGITTAPVFSWRLQSDETNVSQYSYKIVVSRITANGALAQVWNSGEIVTSRTIGIQYGGAPFMTSASYRWTVTIEDNSGGVVSASDQFATSIIHDDEWEAAWIGRNSLCGQTAFPPGDTDISYTVNKLSPVRRFVKHFDLDEMPTIAKVHASAKGIYRLYINGHKVGSDELAPGWTDYRDRITYQSWDVTPFLVEGRNSLAAMVGDGWYVGFIGTDRRHQAQHYGKEPEFLAQLMLDKPSGERTVISTDASWKEQPSDIVYADLLMGQYEDSRREDPLWNLPENNLDKWHDVEVRDHSTKLLVPEIDAGVQAVMHLPAQSVNSRGSGRFIVDFGQNLVGHVRLTLRNQPRGKRIQLNHAEVLNGGELYTANLRTAEPVDVFWTNGKSEQIFEPRFTIHGFRFAEISGFEGSLCKEDIEAIVIHNNVEFLTEFSSSDEALDRLFQNIQWGMRGNFVSVPTDCPQRDERLGWLADAQVFAPTALALADLGPLLRRWMHDVRTAQNSDGAFPDIAPHLIHLREGAPAWGDGGVTIPWNVYKATGDIRVLAEAADSMRDWVNHIKRHNPDLIWTNQVGNNYGDWLQIGEETPKDLLATAYFAYSADLTARTLRLLGRTKEADSVSNLREQIASAFQREFVYADGSIKGDTQGGYLLAIAFSLFENETQKERLAEKLVEAIHRRKDSLTTGFITVGLLCPVLSDIGREDLAFKLLHNDQYPSWLFSVRCGATTIWERWDGWTPESGFQSARMNSFNHYSLGSVGEWFISGILGIKQSQISAGYQDIELVPRFDPYLDHASGSIETPRGRIESSWRRNGGAITWKVSVPPGPAATVLLPPTATYKITEGGKDAILNNGITQLNQYSQGTQMKLGSGTYEFCFQVG